jgi:hypothetical protein
LEKTAFDIEIELVTVRSARDAAMCWAEWSRLDRRVTDLETQLEQKHAN